MNENDNMLPVVAQRGGELTTQATRAQAEVQAAMVIAKKFPRDETAAFNRIMQSCKRIGLAEKALYAFPRGGQVVKGPSVRLAEAIVKAWGNLQVGIEEISQDGGESKVEAFCWDLETNVRETRKFIVKHSRDTKQGRKALTDDRDIYEMTANLGQRRKRACILNVIPQDVIDAAVEQCQATLEAGDGAPLADRIRSMVVAFADLGVSQQMIEKRLGHKIEATIAAEIVTLKSIYASIRDGMAPRDQFFDVGGEVVQSTDTAALAERVKAAAAEASAIPPAPPAVKPFATKPK